MINEKLYRNKLKEALELSYGSMDTIRMKKQWISHDMRVKMLDWVLDTYGVPEQYSGQTTRNLILENRILFPGIMDSLLAEDAEGSV